MGRRLFVPLATAGEAYLIGGPSSSDRFTKGNPKSTSLPGIGRVSADKVERSAATFGVLLKDGDPALLEDAAEEPEEEETVQQGPSVSGGTPEEVRGRCGVALMTLATDLSAHAASVMRMAARMSAGGKMSGIVRRYATSDQAWHDKVLRVAQPVLDLEDAARGRKGRKSVANREAVAEPDNGARAAATASVGSDLPFLRRS